MRKILFCASTASHLINFHLPYMKALQESGYEVHALVNECTEIPYTNKVLAVPFTKRMLSFKNIKSIFAVHRLLSTEKYNQICTNTTLAGLIVRCAVVFLLNRPRVIHIVHGYLFNIATANKQLHYLLPEKMVASVSDVVAVMNEEDYQIASKYHLYKERLIKIPGMGVNLNRFCTVDYQQKKKLRIQHKIELECFVFVYVAEFSKRKNHVFLLEAIACLPTESPVMLLLAGNGATMIEMQDKAKQLGIADKIRFLGYVKDVQPLYQLSDIAVSSSKIEGLPFNIMEAMGCGLPLLISDIKGHRDLVWARNGELFSLEKPFLLAEKIQKFSSNKELCQKMGLESRCIVQAYDINQVYPKVLSIFLHI